MTFIKDSLPSDVSPSASAQCGALLPAVFQNICAVARMWLELDEPIVTWVYCCGVDCVVVLWLHVFDTETVSMIYYHWQQTTNQTRMSI